LNGQDTILTLEERFFARIALKNGLLSETDLALATRDRVASGRPLAQILRARGLLTDAQIAKVREAQVASQVVRLDSLYADIVVERGLLPRSTIESAFHEQRRRRFKVRIGDLLVERGALAIASHRSVLSEMLARLEAEGASFAAPGEKPSIPRTPAAPAESGLHPSLASYGTSPAPRGQTDRLSPEKLAEPTPAPAPPVPPTARVAGASISLQGDSGSEVKDAPPRPTARRPIPPTGEVPSTSFLEENAKALGVREASQRTRAHLHGPDGEASAKLLASALELRLSSADDEPLLLSEEDKKLLEEDRARLESLEKPSPVLERQSPATTGDDSRPSFSPDLYFKRQKRRRRALNAIAGALALALLVVLGVEVLAIHRRQRAFEEARELLKSARASVLAAQGERYAQAQARLERSYGLGVSESERQSLVRQAVVGRAGASAELALEQGDPAGAQAVLRDVLQDRELPSEERARLEVLRARADRDALVFAGKDYESRGDWIHAVKCYKDANDEGASARIRGLMREQVEKLGQEAQKTLAPAQVDELTLHLKEYFELWNDGSLQPILDRVNFSVSMARAREALAKHDAQGAIQRATEALAIREGDRDAQDLLNAAKSRASLDAILTRAASAEADGRASDAVAAYEEARDHAEGAERDDIEGRLRRLRDSQHQSDLRRDRTRLRCLVLELVVKSEWERVLALKPDLERGQDPLAPQILDFAARARGMVFVPAGAFLMGSDVDREKAGSPRHSVVLGAFLVDRIEVRNRDYFRFYHDKGRAPPSHWRENVRRDGKPEQLASGEFVKTFASDEADHPVRYVTWLDANAYAAWLGKRLPTEAEWEKAARGTEGRTFPWGELPVPKLVRLNMDPPLETAPCGSSTDDVSPFGVLDMAGNVCEWVSDALSSPPGKATKRVIRGGSFDTDVKVGRTFARESSEETQALKDVGFRCALDAPPWLDELAR
jgi:formylglycine-generating enzyme required for sulfatase activity